MRPIFITGIGTGIGKTVVAAIVTEALQADYWKPVQAGFEGGTDSLVVKALLSNPGSKLFPESYLLQVPASPHIAARQENIEISLDRIVRDFHQLPVRGGQILVEGAGGILVPLNDREFVINLIRKLDARVILVSRNYLGSINHSLLTAAACRLHQLDVIGWIFNDQYLDYEEEIVRWSGFPRIGSIPSAVDINPAFVQQQAAKLRDALLERLGKEV